MSKRSQKSNTRLIVALIIITVIVVGALLLQKRANLFRKTAINEPYEIQNELDNIDVNAIDNELNQNDADVANF